MNSPPPGIAYVGKPIGPLARALTDFKGNQIGICYITSRWQVHSYIGSHMHQIYATIDGTHYTGRSFGEGMIVRLSRCANQGKGVPGPRGHDWRITYNIKDTDTD